MRRKVSRVNRHEAWAQKPVLREQFERPSSRLGDAHFNLARLLGDMHVKREPVRIGVLAKGRKPRRRNGAHRMGRQPDANIGIICVPRKQGVDVSQHMVDVGV